jgi:hypothetical protein
MRTKQQERAELKRISEIMQKVLLFNSVLFLIITLIRSILC